MKYDFESMQPDEIRALLAERLTVALNEVRSAIVDVHPVQIAHTIQITLANIGFTSGPPGLLSYLDIQRDKATGVFVVHVTGKPADGSVPPSVDTLTCDSELFNWGEHVYTITGPDAEAVEKWVKQVAERSGQRVDWHNSGERAHVKALGDLDAVRRAINELEGELHRVGGIGGFTPAEHDLPWTLR